MLVHYKCNSACSCHVLRQQQQQQQQHRPRPCPKEARSVRFQLKFNAKSISATGPVVPGLLCCKTWRSVGKDIDNWMTVHLKNRKTQKKKRKSNRRGNGKETRFRAEDLHSQSKAAQQLRLQWPINLANSAHNLITICLTNLPAKTLSKSRSRKDRKVRSTHPFSISTTYRQTNEQATSS